jgi:hypothetical protein
MSFKIYFDGDPTLYDVRMFFDLNGDDYTITTNENDIVDINVRSQWHSYNFNDNVKSKTKLDLCIFFSNENLARDTIEECKNNGLYYIINQYDLNRQHSRVLYHDFLFNRTKAYYTNFKFSNDTIKWMWYKNSYVLTNNLNAKTKNKIFLSPTFSYRKSLRYRPQISNFLKPYNNKLGYVSYIEGDNKNFLIPQKILPKCKDINFLESKTMGDYPGFGYSPPHILYYENTFISIFGEICEWGEGYTPSEKTYEPLIKGHFILPFSNCGYIQHLKNLGFIFPTFIDYSYDNIKDDDSRFLAYKEEINRLLSISLEDWRQFWDDNLQLIVHNQNIFYHKPYEKLNLVEFFA